MSISEEAGTKTLTPAAVLFEYALRCRTGIASIMHKRVDLIGIHGVLENQKARQLTGTLFATEKGAGMIGSSELIYLHLSAEDFEAACETNGVSAETVELAISNLEQILSTEYHKCWGWHWKPRA